MYLDRILAATRARVDAARRERSMSDLEGSFEDRPRDLLAAISGEDISLIAEFKRRSPSKGEISPGAQPDETAAAYEAAGASAVSVLTEPEFFGGSNADLGSARAATSLPVLRKDFTIDPYQVVEARAIGADAVLLIVAAIEPGGLLAELFAAADELGLTSLVEVHDMYELERALEVGPRLIGINQRNLATFEIDESLAEKMRPEIPAGAEVVAESGISTRARVVRMQRAGISAILVGESLMRARDPGAAARELLGASAE